MAKHRYIIDIEYTNSPIEHPIFVTVRRDDMEFGTGGKTLKSQLIKIVSKIQSEEESEEMPVR